jgi:hypothetical protein
MTDDIVYKFCGSYGTDILRNLELKVTPPNQFNDPFEFTPRIICSDARGRATGIVMNKKHMKSLYQMLKAEGQFIGTFRDFQRQSRFSLPKMAKVLAEGIPLVAADVQREQGILEKTSARYGVLCLSRKRDSILMWSHYCDKHCGFVIGFDEAHDVFHPTAERGLLPVRYVRERVIFDAAWDESDPRVTDFDEEIIFSKNQDWRYEEELRQMFVLTSLNRRLLGNGTLGYFLAVPPTSFVSVSFGARCSPEFEQSVRSALNQRGLSHVTVEKARLHDTAFALTFQ